MKSKRIISLLTATMMVGSMITAGVTTQAASTIPNSAKGIANKALYKAVVAAADTNKDGKLQVSEADALTELDASEYDVAKLDGISKLKNLKKLNLANGSFTDIQELGSLTALTDLDISGVSAITSLAPLAPLANLESLNASMNDISALESVTSMKKLKSLDLSSNGIANVDGIEALTELTSLNLESNQIVDFGKIAKLTNLESLKLKNNLITSMANVASLTKLKELTIGSKLTAIEGLDKCTELEVLSVGKNIRNLTGLENCKKLRELEVEGYFRSIYNRDTGRSILAENDKLEVIALGNGIETLQGFEDLTNLRELTLTRGANNSPIKKLTYVNDKGETVSPLAKLEKLEKISIVDGQLGEISGLDGLKNLRVLLLSGNSIRTLSGLDKLSGGTYVSLSNNKFDISAEATRKTFEDYVKDKDLVIEIDSEIFANEKYAVSMSLTTKVLTSKSTAISGKGTPGAKLRITNEDGVDLYDQEIAQDGKFNVKIPKQKGDTSVDIYAYKLIGSQEVKSKVVTLDVVPFPAAPKIISAKAKGKKATVKGKANGGNTLMIYKGKKKIASVKVKGSGKFTAKVKGVKKGLKLSAQATLKTGGKTYKSKKVSFKLK